MTTIMVSHRYRTYHFTTMGHILWCCGIVSCHVMWCHVMSCHVMLFVAWCIWLPVISVLVFVIIKNVYIMFPSFVKFVLDATKKEQQKSNVVAQMYMCSDSQPHHHKHKHKHKCQTNVSKCDIAENTLCLSLYIYMSCGTYSCSWIIS